MNKVLLTPQKSNLQSNKNDNYYIAAVSVEGSCEGGKSPRNLGNNASNTPTFLVLASGRFPGLNGAEVRRPMSYYRRSHRGPAERPRSVSRFLLGPPGPPPRSQKAFLPGPRAQPHWQPSVTQQRPSTLPSRLHQHPTQQLHLLVYYGLWSYHGLTKVLLGLTKDLPRSYQGLTQDLPRLTGP